MTTVIRERLPGINQPLAFNRTKGALVTLIDGEHAYAACRAGEAAEGFVRSFRL